MSLKVRSRIPYGNARAVQVKTDGEMPAVHFSVDPHGEPQCLWFCFTLEETEPAATPADGKLRLVLDHCDNLAGVTDPSLLMPVYRPSDKGWFRTKRGDVHTEEDGRCSVAWEVNYPSPALDVAFCFPYGKDEVGRLVHKSKGYWQTDKIGLSHNGRPLMRLRNNPTAPGKRPGLYLIARQHAGETPGSWVLDGVLEHLSRTRKNPFLVWTVPLCDVDGIHGGDYGAHGLPYDMNCGWGATPRRHEHVVIQNDLARWQERCTPTLAIDFHAPGPCETGGVYCRLPPPESNPELHKEAVKWAHTLKDALTDEFAAEKFERAEEEPGPLPGHSFLRYVAGTLGVCAVTVETPYAMVGTTPLSQKAYREIGRRISDALIRRKT